MASSCNHPETKGERVPLFPSHSIDLQADLRERSPLVARNDDAGFVPKQCRSLENFVHLAAAGVFTAVFLKTLEYAISVDATGVVNETLCHAVLKIIIFIPPSIFIVSFLVQRHRFGKSPTASPQPAHHASVCVPARLWTVLYLVAWVAYYLLYLVDTKDEYPSPDLSKARAVTWNFLLCVTLGCTAHLSVVFSNVGPLGLMIFLVPVATPDRYPFDWAPEGCPNDVHHIVGAYGIICALVVWKCCDVEVGVVAERHRGTSTPHAQIDNHSKPCAVYFETISLGCALFPFGFDVTRRCVDGYSDQETKACWPQVVAPSLDDMVLFQNEE